MNVLHKLPISNGISNEKVVNNVSSKINLEKIR